MSDARRRALERAARLDPHDPLLVEALRAERVRAGEQPSLAASLGDQACSTYGDGRAIYGCGYGYGCGNGDDHSNVYFYGYGDGDIYGDGDGDGFGDGRGGPYRWGRTM